MSEKLLAKISDLQKFYNNEMILHVNCFSVYDGDRIGVIGVNGAGKSTLLKLLAKEIEPESGTVKHYATLAVIPQLAENERQPGVAHGKAYSEFSAPLESSNHLSGGEVMRQKLAEAFSAPSALLLADEPTANLDAAGKAVFSGYLKRYTGAVILVSHDRDLLDSVCNRIAEVECGGVTVYPGNYSEYEEQKRRRIINQNTEHEKYTAEKKRLERARVACTEKSRRMKKTPSRMGNSEARLHKTETRDRRKSVDGRAMNIAARLEQLEYVPEVKFSRPHIQKVSALELPNRYAAEARDLTVTFGGRRILDQVGFLLKTGSHTALTGVNGAGKTCLLNAVASRHPAVYLPPRVVTAVFRQDLAFSDPAESVLNCVMEDTAQEQSTVRMMLANLQIGKEMLGRPVGVLSGGERVKVQLVKALTAKANLLLLDEPTNYLDIPSLAALESFFQEYPATILYVSHDERFIKNTASCVWRLEDGRVTTS